MLLVTKKVRLVGVQFVFEICDCNDKLSFITKIKLGNLNKYINIYIFLVYLGYW